MGWQEVFQEDKNEGIEMISMGLKAEPKEPDETEERVGMYGTKNMNQVNKDSWEREVKETGKEMCLIDVNWTVTWQTFPEDFLYTENCACMQRQPCSQQTFIILLYINTLSEKTKTGWLYLENGSKQ